MDLICQMRYGLQYHITLDAKSNSADTVKKNPSKNVLSQMIKTVSIRKLNDFNFQWTKLFFRIFQAIWHSFLHFSRAIDVP